MELLAVLFLLLVIVRGRVKTHVPKNGKGGIPYVRHSTSYAARRGRKAAKTDYSGDDWGW